MRIAEACRRQAEACGSLGSPMYAHLLHQVALAVEAGDGHGEILTTVLAGHEDDPGPSALALRLLGSVHRLVLERRAGALATFYPSVGGTWEPVSGWRAFLDLLAEQPDAVREWLDRPPQTNEVGRSAAFLGGLLHLDRRLPLRLMEIGASGGLNLFCDRYGYIPERGLPVGPADPAAPVLRGAWTGRSLEPWPEMRVVERRGCDPRPVDIVTTEGRLALTAYVWPDQPARHERLRAALAVARRTPVKVERASAKDFVDDLALQPGTTTVLLHSVVWQYLSAPEQAQVSARLEALGAQAGADQPLAHLRAEPWRRTPGADRDFWVRLRAWPGGEDRALGLMAPHGPPVAWG